MSPDIRWEVPQTIDVINPGEDRVVTFSGFEGVPFSLILPANTFQDPDNSDHLTLAVEVERERRLLRLLRPQTAARLPFPESLAH